MLTVLTLTFNFPFHDLTMYLTLLRQLIVKYSCHGGYMVATVLLTWMDHGNILIIITQTDLHLILSCWNKKWISNRFSGRMLWFSPREWQNYCGSLSDWKKVLSILMSSCVVYHVNCISIVNGNFCICAFRNVYLKSAKGNVHTN